MRTPRPFLLWSALILTASWSLALPPPEINSFSEAAGAQPRLALAAAMPPGGALPYLDRFIDAMSAGSRTGAAPGLPPFPELSPRTPSPKKAPSRALRTPVVPTPKPTAAYLRTFRARLSHPEVTDRYDELILKYAEAYKLEPRLLKAIIAAESEFTPMAVSPRGARGLMQVMPATAEELGVPPSQLQDPESGLRAGAAYLAVLFKTGLRRYDLQGVAFKDAPMWLKQRVIAAYHGGPRHLFHNRWHRQTRNYVRKVFLFYRSGVTDFRGPQGATSVKPGACTGPSAGILY